MLHGKSRQLQHRPQSQRTGQLVAPAALCSWKAWNIMKQVFWLRLNQTTTDKAQHMVYHFCPGSLQLGRQGIPPASESEEPTLERIQFLGRPEDETESGVYPTQSSTAASQKQTAYHVLRKEGQAHQIYLKVADSRDRPGNCKMRMKLAMVCQKLWQLSGGDCCCLSNSVRENSQGAPA